MAFSPRTERDRLNRFPAQIPDEDLRVFFLLSDADQTAINKQREAHTRLGFAMQLCALRYLGFAPDDLSTAPEDAVLYVAQQLAVSPDALARLWPPDSHPHDSTSSRSKPIWAFALPPRWISMPCKCGWWNGP